VSLVLWRWPVCPGARGLNVRLQTEFDAKPSFDPSVEVPHGDLVESLDQIDAPVEVLEPLQLDAVLPLPCRPVGYDRGKRFELPGEGGELAVVSSDLGVGAGDAVLDLAAPGGTGASADGTAPVEVF
jgi:hypothetical protein